METNVSLIGDIVAGKVNWRLKVRVINLWTVPNRNFPHEINTLEMIFLDEQVVKYFHQTIQSNTG